MAPERSAGHREIEHTADVGFEAWGPDIDTLFVEATQALIELVCDSSTAAGGERKQLRVEGSTLEEQLVNWLREVYLLLELDRWLPVAATTVRCDERGVRGVVLGELYDAQRHAVHTAIKAVTYHDLAVRRDDAGSWRTRVIVDV